MEKFESKRSESMVEDTLVEEVREQLAQELQDLADFQGTGWINRDGCLRIIQKLKANEPVDIPGPFYSDYLDGVIQQQGIQQSDPRYSQIWKKIESPDQG